ncbi:hypothetical protein K3G39_20570, partial [Pontibacter sp. HSC-14F20]|uniref:hypothetical protein n=1 Tax=Pontibacter sp. HSC-14F20 TaxID=2864136 RepID=UPI001C73DD9A
MIGTPNNGSGITGINWTSNVLVENLYTGSSGSWGAGATVSGRSLADAINQAMSYAQSAGITHVVFQGGIQGEGRYKNPGAGLTTQQLGDLIKSLENNAMFAVAAGNGGIKMSVTDPTNASVKSGE